jgi:DNA-binding XRE family transcriptional regulator
MSQKTVIRLVGGRVERMHEEGALGNAVHPAYLAGSTRSAPDDLVLIAQADLDELIEDRLAEAAYRRTRDQETVPDSIVRRLVAGENPIAVWRDHRGMTLRALADAAGLDPGYLSQLENGKRAGPVATIKKIAAALRVDLDDLT